MHWVDHADAHQWLEGIEPASLDAIVTDPPYEIAFMGRAWDSSGAAFDVEIWRGALRALKPGGHLLAFGAARTYHRLAVAIEDAGFEIRDQMQWLYGSGMPKSLDVAKAIDRTRIEDLEPIRVVCRYLRAAMDAAGLKSRDLAPVFGCHSRLVDHWAARDTDSQPSLPTDAQWETLRGLEALRLGGDLDDEVRRLNERKGQPGDAWAERPIVGQAVMHDTTKVALGFTGPRHSGSNAGATRVVDVTTAASELSARWQGWGTGLKPAHEPICVARKPVTPTVARTVLEYGTGALNLDGCRVGEATEEELARWPSNVIADRLAGLMIDRQEPGSSRFFYCPKPTAEERGQGNSHPTVKPIELMRYLCRLVTPPGGTVADIFAGSGTTGVAAKLEGFDFKGCELGPAHVELCNDRIRRAIESPALYAPAEIETPSNQRGLFD